MGIQIRQPGSSHGSALSSVMGMFNSAKQGYTAVKGDSGGISKPQFSTGAFDPSASPLGGKDMAGQMADGADAFQGQMDAIMRRTYGLQSGAKAGAMDSEFGGATAGAGAGEAGYGAAGGAEAAGAAGAGEGGIDALALV